MSNAHNKADILSNVQNYSINLLWVSNSAKDQAYIYSNEQDELVAKLLMPAIRWALENPTADVNIWYDSILHEPHAILNTQKVLDENNSGCRNIKLRDIRSIKVVNDNAVLFNADMPPYYKIDFFKLLIFLHELRDSMKDAVIYSDLDVCDLRENHKRMNKEELFNQESLIKLQEVGILLNDSKKYPQMPENKFIQMVNDEKAILALRYSINACLMRGMHVLNSMSAQEQEEFMPMMYHQPFVSTTLEIYRLYKLIKLGAMKVRADFIGGGAGAKWEEYNPDKDGYELFGNELYENDDSDDFDDSDDSDDSDDAGDLEGLDGIAPFIYVDKEGGRIPLQDIFMINPTNYYHDDSHLRTRDDTGTRDGNAHTDVCGVVPSQPDIPYIAILVGPDPCGPDDGLHTMGSNDGYGAAAMSGEF